MEYSQGNIGRVFVATITEGEEVYPCIEEISDLLWSCVWEG